MRSFAAPVVGGLALLALLLPAFVRGLARAPDVAVRTRPLVTQVGVLAESGVTQGFRCETAGLRRIDVELVSWGGAGERALELQLRLDSPISPAVRTGRLEPRLFEHGDRGRFDFEPVADSAGRDVYFTLRPAPGDGTCTASPWWRFRGQVGADVPWGDREVVGEVAGELRSPHRALSALLFGVTRASGGEARLELWSVEDPDERRTVSRDMGQVEGGYVAFPFEPVEASRWQRFAYRLVLPPEARVVAGPDGPTVKTLHGRRPAAPRLLGAETERAGASAADRDLHFQAYAGDAASAAWSRLVERVGARGVLALVTWILGVALVLRTVARPPSGVRRARGLLVVAALALALPYALLLPPWQGEDEPWQLEYAQYLADGHWPAEGPDITAEQVEEHPYTHLQVRRRLPSVPYERIEAVQAEIARSMQEHEYAARVDWASPWLEWRVFDEVAPGFTAVNHPPLFAFVGSLPLRLVQDFGVRGRLHVVRLVSLGAFLLAVLAAFEAARLAGAGPGGAFLSGALAAAYPVFARSSAVFNNDLAAQAVAPWLLVACLVVLARGWSRRRLFALALLALLAISAKPTAVAGLVLLPLVAVLAPGEGRGRRAALALAGIGVLAVVAALTWWSQHSTAMPTDLQALGQRLASSLTAEPWRALGRTALGTFNGESRELEGVPASLFAAAGLLAAAGLAVRLIRADEPLIRRALLFCALFLCVQLALVALRGVGTARYVLPAVPALAVLLGAATTALPEGRRTIASFALTWALLLYGGHALWNGLVWNQHVVLGS